MSTNTTEWVRGQNTNMDKVMERIKKLLNLANNAGTEEEASKAAQMAQEMLAAYNLEMSQIDALQDATASAESGKRVKENYTRSAMFQYQRVLWKALAEANFCWYEAVPVYKTNKLGNMMRSTYHHYLIGREVNVLGTRMMGDYLEETINRLVPFKPGRDSSKSWISWKEGCTARLVERLNEKKWEMVRESQRKQEEAVAQNSSSTALALADVVKSEEDANYLFVHGREAYERMLSWRHDQENCQCEHCVARRKQAERWAAQRALPGEVEEPKIETEAQKRKREEKERRASARYWRQDEARRQRKWAKKDVSAYRAGEEMGSKIPAR